MRNYTTYKTKKHPIEIDPNSAPAIVLVSPQLGENIGATARAMMNFGFADLRIVSPRDGWPNAKAEEMSAHALPIIKNAKIFDSLSDSLHDIHYAIAATARVRGLEINSYTPQESCEKLVTAKRNGQNLAIVFGQENNGLTNEDIARCNAIVTIPTHPANTSLNLGQSVVVLTYQYFIENTKNNNNTNNKSSNSATVKEVESLYEHIESDLERNGFYKSKDIRPVMQKNIRVMLARAELTQQEVKTIHGMIRFLGR